MTNNNVLRTDELDNAIDYLEKAAYYYQHKEDDYWFKWLTISLHGALYGFGVKAAKGINDQRVLEVRLSKKKYDIKKQEIIDYYKNDLGFKNDDESLLDEIILHNLSMLLNINDIIDLCKDEEIMNQRYHSKALETTEAQDEAIKRLTNYRNDFAHFKPSGLSIITVDDLWIVAEVAKVIKFLAFDCGNIFFSDLEVKEKVKESLRILLSEYNN